MEEINTKTCERVDDLVGFLYGELDELESRRFERHLHECAACETEYAAFGQIHGSLMAWRDESLGLGRTALAATAASVAPAVTSKRMPVKSALNALREFFALSPLWMKGAAAFATVLFCVCGVLAIAYLQTHPVPIDSAKAGSDKVFTVEELNQQVAAAIEKTRQEQRDKVDTPAQPPVDAPRKFIVRSGSARPTHDAVGKLRRPFTQQERNELAADLRLLSSKDEDDLELISDSDRP
jgi:hypothetical protein